MPDKSCTFDNGIDVNDSCLNGLSLKSSYCTSEESCQNILAPSIRENHLDIIAL